MAGARRLLRRLFVAAAIAQVLSPPAASIVDGLLQQQGQAAQCPGQHVERFGSTGCKPVHSDDCALCRVVATAASPSVPPALPERPVCCSLAPACPTSRRVSAVPHALPASRAPPVFGDIVGDRA